LELDPQLVEAHALLAQTSARNWQWPEADAEYQRAIELSPAIAGVHADYAYWFLCRGRIKRLFSWRDVRRNLTRLALHGIEVGWILFHARPLDEASGIAHCADHST